MAEPPVCACCGARPASHTFPGITMRNRDLAGRPIAAECVTELFGVGLGAGEMANRIRARDAALPPPDL